MEQVSLYEWIREHVEDGRLPDSFSLPPEHVEADSKATLKFADGAWDGILMYHMAPAEIPVEPLAEALSLVVEGHRQEAQRKLSEFSRENKALRTIDELQKYIIEHRDSLDAGKIFDFAEQLARNSSERELVKYGLAILELFQYREEEFDEMIRTLALSDEFTLFCVFLMRTWENAEEEILQAAQKVTGWGRIFAVEQLEADSEETKQWLLTEGFRNEILPDYSALTCYEKSDMLDWLGKEMTEKEFRGAGDLLQALLSEEPLAGISAVEEKEELFQRYLSQAKARKLTPEDYEVLQALIDYEEGQEEKDLEVVKSCTQLLTEPEGIACITAAVANGKNLALAKKRGLPYLEAAFHSLEQDLEQNYTNLYLLMPEENYVDPCIALFEEKLPLDAMASGPDLEMGTEPQFRRYQMLLYILQFLKNYPGKGRKLLKTALQSPVINNRNMALTVLEEWIKAAEGSFQEKYPEFYHIVKEGIKAEPEESVRNRMEQLLG